MQLVAGDTVIAQVMSDEVQQRPFSVIGLNVFVTDEEPIKYV